MLFSVSSFQLARIVYSWVPPTIYMPALGWSR